MRLLTPRSTRRNKLDHADLRGRSEPKRTAHLAHAICVANMSEASYEAHCKYDRRRPKRDERDAQIRKRAAEKLKAPPKPVFEDAIPLPPAGHRSTYTGPGSKWHRRMVAAGKK